MIFSNKQKILFDGDSITDAGRDRNNFDSYGYGYVALVIEHLQAHHANLELQFLTRGVGGDTTRNMLERFERDVLTHKPDWVSNSSSDTASFGSGSKNRQTSLTPIAIMKTPKIGMSCARKTLSAFWRQPRRCTPARG